MKNSKIVYTALWAGLIFGLIFAGIFATEAYLRHLGASISDGFEHDRFISKRNTFISFTVAAFGLSCLQGFALATVKKTKNVT